MANQPEKHEKTMCYKATVMDWKAVGKFADFII